MASDDESHSRSKRPAPMTRQSSSQSHISQSPSEGGHQRATHHKAQRHHVVGTRVQRNTSFGKNLNKLTKAEKQAHQGAEHGGRNHRRSQSGNSVSAPSSPHARPGFKRHASSGAIVRANQAQVQANLRRNHSSGHLPPRQGHGKHAVKLKGDHAASRRALATPNRSRQSSPDPGAGVHFDLADEEDEEGDEAGWTEESASQSPTTTRSNTRSNSVILDAQHRAAEINMERNRGQPSQQVGTSREPSTQAAQTLSDRTRSSTQLNGGSSYQHSRPPDADMITSRLLQRSASHHVPPKTTSVAATVVSSSDRHNLLNHTAGSVGSTLVDTSGRDLVSRFMDGDGSAGTPHDGAYMAGHGDKDSDEGGGLDKSKRNKSMPSFRGGADTPSKTPQRSGTTTPTNLPPSRTQQKLMLQRASSNVEPQKLVPVTLPRTGGPTYLQTSIQYNANGEGRLDPRLLQQFNHVAVEYNVVRRYRNPLADALGRISQMPGVTVKRQMGKLQKANGGGTGTNSLSTSFNDGAAETEGGGSGRRSRVSFEKGVVSSSRAEAEAEFEGRQSFESEHARSRNEAEEMCRRLWESAEVVEAD